MGGDNIKSPEVQMKKYNNVEKKHMGRAVVQNERDTKRSQSIETGTMTRYGFRVRTVFHDTWNIMTAIEDHGAVEFRPIPLTNKDGKPSGFFGVEVVGIPNPWDGGSIPWIVTEHRHDKRTATLLAKVAEKGGDKEVCAIFWECGRSIDRLEEVDAQKMRREGWVI